MNTILSRTCAALASALITFAVGAAIDSLAVPGHADSRIALAAHAGTPG